MTTATITPGIIPNLDIEDYGSDNLPGCPAPTLNSGLANRLLERSEAHAAFAHPKLNPAWKPKPPTDLMNIGSAAHLMLLQPERMDDILRVPYTDWRTHASQELRDDAIADGKIPLLAPTADAVVAMVNEAQAALDGSPDLVNLGATANEVTYWWPEVRMNTRLEERKVYLRCRPDMASTDGAIIISYKTTGRVAHPDAYIRTMLDAGHHLQAAFEIAGIEHRLGARVQNYVWLVQETEEPYACSLIGMSPVMRHLALARFDQAVNRWAEAMATGQFPGYPDPEHQGRIAYPEVPAWRLRELEDME